MNLKTNCFSQKAQTLTELATFGSALLLVLSFFIRYGMYYNYQQQAQMEAFRWAMKLSFNQDQIGDHSSLIPANPLVLAKDVHIPDPRDRAAAGDRVTVMGSGEIAWSNELQKSQEYGKEPKPRIHYLINYDPADLSTHELAFDLADYKTYDWGDTGGSITVRSLDKGTEYKGYKEYEISQGQTKVYETEVAGEGNKKFLKVLLAADCEPNYCPTDIVNAADVDKALHAAQKELSNKYEQIIEVVGAVDNPVAEFKTLDFQLGDIDTDYMGLTNPDVPADKVQGLLPDKEAGIQRSGSIALEEDSTTYKSTTKIDTTETIKHKIRGKEKENLLPNTYTFTRNLEKTWETSK